MNNHKSLKSNKYIEVKEYLDKLNFDESHFVNSNDICTPMGCVEEMVDSIPKSFWKKENLILQLGLLRMMINYLIFLRRKNFHHLIW